MMLTRDLWDLPDDWWGAVPPWLYSLNEHLKASWVGAFRFPVLESSGWVYDTWSIGGTIDRWRVEEGRIAAAGSVRRPRPTGDAWRRIEDRGALELPEATKRSRLDGISLIPPEAWRPGRWGFAAEFGRGFVDGVIDDPSTASDCSYTRNGAALADAIGSDRKPVSIAWVAPDGHACGTEELIGRLSGRGHRLVRLPATRWWPTVAGMPSWS